MFDHPQRCPPRPACRSLCHPERSQGRFDCHPERRAKPEAEGSAGHSRQISPLPPVGRNDKWGRPRWCFHRARSCQLPVPGGAETASTALTSATFPYQVDFQTDHLAHFSSSFVSGGHENSPTSHGLPNFALNQNLPLRRFSKCLAIRKDALPVPHVIPYAIPGVSGGAPDMSS